MVRQLWFAAALLLLSGCHDDKPAKGPAERAGQGIDRAAQKTGEALHHAAVKTDEAASRAVRATGEAFERAGKKLKRAPKATQPEDWPAAPK